MKCGDIVKFRLVEEFETPQDLLLEISKYNKQETRDRVGNTYTPSPRYSGQGRKWKNGELDDYLAKEFNVPAGMLKSDYVMHHIDGDHTNDEPSNIAILPKSVHDRMGVSWEELKRAVGEKFRKVPMTIGGKKGYVTLLLDANTITALGPKHTPNKVQSLFSILKRFI